MHTKVQQVRPHASILHSLTCFKVRESLESPMETITGSLSRLSHSHPTPVELKQSLKAVLRTLASSPELRRPSIEKIQENIPLDNLSRRWIETTIAGDGGSSPESKSKSAQDSPPPAPKEPQAQDDALLLDLESLTRWDFNVFQHSEQTLLAYASHIFTSLDLCSQVPLWSSFPFSSL